MELTQKIFLSVLSLFVLGKLVVDGLQLDDSHQPIFWISFFLLASGLSEFHHLKNQSVFFRFHTIFFMIILMLYALFIVGSISFLSTSKSPSSNSSPRPSSNEQIVDLTAITWPLLTLSSLPTLYTIISLREISDDNSSPLNAAKLYDVSLPLNFIIVRFVSYDLCICR
jgi:hypothetical protein